MRARRRRRRVSNSTPRVSATPVESSRSSRRRPISGFARKPISTSDSPMPVAGELVTIDCLHLLSGGKDSTYALYQLVERGWKVHALTLDNGFISEGAKENVRRSIADLGITHEFATTEAMNEIFRDSLDRYSNVCQGCYKTIYTIAVARARALGIPVIVTGLSRGQFFETRLVPHQFESGRLRSRRDRPDRARGPARVPPDARCRHRVVARATGVRRHLRPRRDRVRRLLPLRRRRPGGAVFASWRSGRRGFVRPTRAARPTA